MVGWVKEEILPVYKWRKGYGPIAGLRMFLEENDLIEGFGWGAAGWNPRRLISK
jgi:hypothetical protein